MNLVRQGQEGGQALPGAGGLQEEELLGEGGHGVDVGPRAPLLEALAVPHLAHRSPTSGASPSGSRACAPSPTPPPPPSWRRRWSEGPSGALEPDEKFSS